MVLNSILIYSEKSSNRLTYILKTLFQEGLGIDFKQTQNKDEFIAESGAKINYSNEDIENCVAIKPHSILFDFGIKDYHLEVIANSRFQKTLFKTANIEIPFDLFGASFWLLSRYEEYLPHKTDIYNRFHYKSSLAYQYDFIQTPLINLWLIELKKILLNYYTSLIFTERKYNFLSSIDIDNAYKYKFKGFVRTVAGIISERSFSKTKLRFQIITGTIKDPFDCYDFLIDTHKEALTKAIYFFLLGDYGPNDKNHSASDLRFQSLIKHLGDYSMVGIHPSFGSTNNLRQLKVETSRLSNITHKIITKSRQHFSVLKFPQTYQDLLQTGILADYSMGYTNCNGFRASYCYPFKWFSLDNESVSSLTIHPFSFTENAILSIAQKENLSLIEMSRGIVNEVKKYNGQFISIFHNESFNDDVKLFYKEFLDLAKP